MLASWWACRRESGCDGRESQTDDSADGYRGCCLVGFRAVIHSIYKRSLPARKVSLRMVLTCASSRHNPEVSGNSPGSTKAQQSA